MSSTQRLCLCFLTSVWLAGLGPGAHTEIVEPMRQAPHAIAGHDVLQAFSQMNSALNTVMFRGSADFIAEDSRHHFWFACYRCASVAMYDQERGGWKVFGDHQTPEGIDLAYSDEALLPLNVASIAESPDGRVWFADDWANWDSRDKKRRSPAACFTYFQNGRWTAAKVPLSSSSESESTGMFEGNHRRRLWFWRGGELVSYDGVKWSPTIKLREVLGGDVLGGWTIRAGLEDRDGRLWLKTTHGFVKSDPEQRAWARCPEIYKAIGQTSDVISQDREGRLWFFYLLSAAAYDPRNGKITRFNAPSKLPGMEDEAFKINAVYEDKYGRLLFGLDSGLVSYTSESGKWEFFDLWPFELGSGVMTIKEDDSRRIWISATLGVIVLAP